MPTINFLKNRQPITVHDGANLMNALLQANIPVASSCEGEAVCAKCKITIIKGAENLTPENEAELILKARFNLGPNVRISCQTFIRGDITIDATYW